METGQHGMVALLLGFLNRSRLLRYAFNGAISTVVHFMALLAGIHLVKFNSFGVANFIAALFGTTCSFLGNRYFVFQDSRRPFIAQAGSFALLYMAAASFHGMFLHVWSDVYKLHYAIGFLCATTIQVVLVYFANRTFVFK